MGNFTTTDAGDVRALEVDPVHPSEQPDADADLFEPAVLDVDGQNLRQPLGRDELRIDRKPPHASRPPLAMT